MAVVKENQLELVASCSTASFQDFLVPQKELLRSQIDQLQNIVITQCKLTGVNPLSQEMAASALSIKIGKRPRDLLNPKAIKYMQSIFSIKDAIGKKESREISALFGVTATQVREFFAGQRSRVRRFVRLSSEKAIRSKACKEAQDEPSCSDSYMPIDPVPLNSVCPSSTEGPSCSTPDEVLPGINDTDKHFLENIFSLMREEETFSGQVKLMEWILQIQNSSVLYWFLTQGGVMILATWLSQAVVEEQTSVLHDILKVLCHLPLHKAIPVHMSAILQSVNKLRFYRASDISNRARILLSRWSKIFARSQGVRKRNAIRSSSDAQDEMLLKQSIGEIMENESWESKADILEETSTLSLEISENLRKFESPQSLKLLTASTDDSNKKLIRGVSSSQTRERRKVLMVEQPGQKTAGRSPQVARSVQATQGRPLSADDIQKAKMRAQFMQSKYGKAVTSSDEFSQSQVKKEGSNMCSSSQASVILAPSPSKAHVRSKVVEHKKPMKFLSKVSNQQVAPRDNKMSSEDLEEPSWKKWRRVRFQWQTPPEMRISGAWSIATGENSKEIEIQKNRIRREKEIIYKTVQEIPSDPKEPWDREMDYDDTLTPEIPTEQLPDVDGAEMVASLHESEETAVTSTSMVSHNSNGDAAEPDLELLAVLLKNPELVFALTTAQGGTLSSEETVKLLDMIKANGVSSLGSLAGLGRKTEENVEVSLPSPTPSSNPVTSGWRTDFAKTPFSQQNATVNIEAYDMVGVAATTSQQEKFPASRLVRPQIPTAGMVAPQQPVSVPPFSQQAIRQLSLPQTARVLPEKRTPSVIPSLHQSAPVNSPNIQMPASEIVINMNNFSVSSLPLFNLLAAASSSVNNLEIPTAAFPSARLLPTPTRLQTQQQSPVILDPQLSTPWRTRQGLASNFRSQTNNSNYNAFIRGPVQAPLQPGPPWERDEFMDEPEFESWILRNRRIGSPEYMGGRSYMEPRMNLGHNYRPERPGQRNQPSGYRDHSRNGHRRGHERRR